MNIEQIQRDAARHMLAADYEAALEQFNVLHRLDPMNYGATMGVGECLQRLGRWTDALDWYHAGLQCFPGAPEINLRLASIEVETGNLPRATKLYAELASVEPGNMWAWIGLADIAHRSGKAADAEAILLETLTRLGPHQDILLRLAHMANASQDFVQAADYFEQAAAYIAVELERYPGHQGLAHQEAQTRIDFALATARAAKAAGRLTAGIQKLEAASALTSSSLIKQHLATLHFENSDVHAVLRILKDVPVNELEPRSLRHLAFSFARAGRMVEAASLADCGSAVYGALALQEMAIGLTDAGALRLAAATWARATAASEGSEANRCGWIDVLIAMRDVDRAICVTDDGLQQLPTSIELLNRRAHLFFEVGDARAARQVWAACLTQCPDNIYASRGTLWALSSLGLYEEARQCIAGMSPILRADQQIQIAATRCTQRDEVTRHQNYTIANTIEYGAPFESVVHAFKLQDIQNILLAENVIWNRYYHTPSGKILDMLVDLYQPELLGTFAKLTVQFLRFNEYPTPAAFRAYVLTLLSYGYHLHALTICLARCREPYLLTTLAILTRKTSLEIKLLEMWCASRKEPFTGQDDEDLMSMRAHALMLSGRIPVINLSWSNIVKTKLVERYRSSVDLLSLHCEAVKQKYKQPKRRLRRVALCVSGQLRGYRTAFPSLRTALRNSCELDIFVHSWERVGGNLGAQRTYERFFPPRCRMLLPETVWISDNFETMFPKTRQTLVGDAFVTASEIREFYGTSHVMIEGEAAFEARWRDEVNLKFNNSYNQMKLFYKINACNTMLQNYIENTGLSYDLVIRVRPDLQFDHLLIDEAYDLCSDGVSIGSTFAVQDGFSDQFGIGTPEAMSAYCSIWDFAIARGATDYLPGVNGHGDRLMGRHLFGIGLSPAILRETRITGAISASVADAQVAQALRTDRATAIAHGLPEVVLDDFLLAFDTQAGLASDVVSADDPQSV